MPVARPYLRLLAPALVAAVLLGSCKDSSTGPRTPAIQPVSPGQSAEQLIGSSGGTVSLLTTEGSRFDLELPSGAVASATTIQVSTVATSGNQLFHLRFAPAGLMLAEGREAVLTITVPGDDGFPQGGGVLYDGVPVSVERVSDGRIRVRLTAFAEDPLPALRDEQASAPSASNTQPLCNGGPSAGTFASGGLVGSSQLELIIYGSCMVAAVQRLASTGQHADAVRAALSAAALLQAAGLQPNGLASVEQFLSAASSSACAAYRQALDAATTATVTTFGSLQPVVRPIFFWEQVVQQLGARCANVGATEYHAVVGAKTDQAMAFYQSRRSSNAQSALDAQIIDVGSTEYTQALAEARGNRALVQQVQTVPAGAAVKTFAREQIRERAQPELLTTMLEAPWRSCRNTGSYSALIELMEPMENAEEIQEAAQYCGTLLAAEARNNAGAVLETLAPTLGGVSATAKTTTGSLRVETDGVIRLSGPIRALQCPAGSGGGSEQLQLRLNNAVLQTLGSAPYLSNVLEIDVAQALQSAGINAQQFTQATLGVYRAGTPCGGFWGEAPAPLLTLRIQRGICVPSSGRDHCVTVMMDGGVPLEFPTALSDRNAHVVASGGNGPVIWHKGGTTPLPAGFWTHAGSESLVSVAIADNGAVAGFLVSGGGSYSLDSIVPALWVPGSGQGPRPLLAQPLYSAKSVPSWLGGSSLTAVRTTLNTLTISPQGRVTFTTYESPDSWPADDIGYCASIVTTSGNEFDCARYRRFEAFTDGSGLATQVQEIAVPQTGAINFPLFDGGTGVGRYGFLDSLSALPSVLGGVGAYRRLNFTFSARELQADQPPVLGRRHLAADRAGRTLSYVSGYSVFPATTAIPAGWSVGALSLAGHLQVCSADGLTVRLVQLTDNSTVMEVAPYEITHQGQVVSVRGSCYTGQRGVDSEGRMLAIGWNDATQREVALIITPAGVPLP